MESGACVYSRIVFFSSKNGRSVRLGCFVAKCSVLGDNVLTGEAEEGYGCFAPAFPGPEAASGVVCGVAALRQMDQTIFTKPSREEGLLVSTPPCRLSFHPFFLLCPMDFSITSHLALSGLILSLADINLNSPNKGLLSDSMTDVPVDTAVAAQTPAVEGLTEAEEEELRAELMKVLCLLLAGLWYHELRPS